MASRALRWSPALRTAAWVSTVWYHHHGALKHTVLHDKVQVRERFGESMASMAARATHIDDRGTIGKTGPVKPVDEVSEADAIGGCYVVHVGCEHRYP